MINRTLLYTFLAFFAGLGASDVLGQDLTITNARIIVGNGTVINSGSVVVKGGRVAAVSQGGPSATAGRTIDAKGMTVMPGFIDAHRHIMGGNDERWFKEQSVARMQEYLESGYTTLMSGGGPVPGIIELKRRIDKGELKGPRIITSGRADPPNFKTADAARAEVRKLAQAGVEIIKARIDPDAPAQQTEMLAVITDEARRFKLDVMVHAVSPAAMLAAVKAGTTKLVHTPHNGWLTEAEAKVVKDAGIEVLSCIGFGVPVFGVYNNDNVPTFRDGNPWPSGILDGKGRGREAGEKAVNARTLWDSGVTFGFGTDTNYHPREGLAHELRALNLMFSTRDMVKLMGPNTAAFIEKSNELGTIEPGKLADIVMLEGNPLEGYWNFLTARVVIKGGEVMVDKRGTPSAAAAPAELKVLSVGAVQPALGQIAERFKTETGNVVTIQQDTAPGITKRLASGEAADILIAPPDIVADMTKSGKAAAPTKMLVARVGIGVAARRDVKLDVRTVDALKKALLAADTVVYNEGSSGQYLEKLFGRMGIAAELKSKTRRYANGGQVSQHILDGKGMEIGFVPIPNIKTNEARGLQFVGPLPGDAQNFTPYEGIVITGGKSADAAAAFIRYLTSPAAKQLFAAAGVD